MPRNDQYSEALFREGILGQMLRVHPKVITRGRLYENAHYLPPGRVNAAKAPAPTLEAFASTVRSQDPFPNIVFVAFRGFRSPMRYGD